MTCVMQATVSGSESMQVPCLVPRLPGGPIPQVLNGEIYPPSVEEAPVLMHYPQGIPPQRQMAVGQEVFGLLPGLMLYATIWLREHNRVCDLLKAEHPTWGDEQLFQTARLILIGEDAKPALSWKAIPSVPKSRG